MASASTCASDEPKGSTTTVRANTEGSGYSGRRPDPTIVSHTSLFPLLVDSPQPQAPAGEVLRSEGTRNLDAEREYGCNGSDPCGTNSHADAGEAPSPSVSPLGLVPSPPSVFSSWSSSVVSVPHSTCSPALSPDASVIRRSAALRSPPRRAHIPLEETIGYQNLEMFLAALLQTCSFLATQNERTAALVLFATLRRVVDKRLLTLKRWACRRWHVATVCGVPPGRQKREDCRLLTLAKTMEDLTNNKTIESGRGFASTVLDVADDFPPASQNKHAGKLRAKDARTKVKRGLRRDTGGGFCTSQTAVASAFFGVDTPQSTASLVFGSGLAAAVADSSHAAGKERDTNRKEQRDRTMRKEGKQQITKERKVRSGPLSQGFLECKQHKVARDRPTRKEESDNKGEVSDKAVDAAVPLCVSSSSSLPSPSASSGASSFLLSPSALSSPLSDTVSQARPPDGLHVELKGNKQQTTDVERAESEFRSFPLRGKSFAEDGICPRIDPSALGKTGYVSKRTGKKKAPCPRTAFSASGKVVEKQQKQQPHKQEETKEQQQEQQTAQEEQDQKGRKSAVQRLLERKQQQGKHTGRTFFSASKADSINGEYSGSSDAEYLPFPQSPKSKPAMSRQGHLALQKQGYLPFLSSTGYGGDTAEPTTRPKVLAAQKHT